MHFHLLCFSVTLQMDSLFSCEVSSSSTINYPCGCLNLRLSNVERDHVMSCPKPYTYTTPFDFVRYIRNPATFHSSKPEIQGQSQIVSTDPFNQYNTENVMRKDPGLVRIDQYMAVLNYIRQNVQGCTVFYTVTDRLLKHMFAQLLPIIVGDERYNIDPAKYHLYAELKAVPVRSFITTARQIGKTTTMAIAVAALLCVADGMDLCKIYARTQNQAVNLLSELKSIFFRLPLSLRPKEILKQNETMLSVRSESNGLAATVAAAPGNVEGIRGHKPRVIVVDEYQFTLPEFWTQHIWALTQVTTRVLICASTPGEPGSYMAAETNRMKTVPAQYPESCVLDFSLVCQKHRDDDEPLLCRCKLDYLPPWKNVAAIRQAQGQYGDGNSADFIQEVLGEPVSSGTRIFDPKKLAAFFNTPAINIDMPPQGNVIFVAVDPSGGGESELAIASMLYMENSQLMLIGLDSAMTKKLGAVDICEFVRVHLRKLRRHPYIRNIVMVPIVEDQGGVPMAQTICDIFSEPEFLPTVYLVGHKVDSSCRSDGVPTTRAIKENMVFLVESLLNEARLKLLSTLVTTGSRNAQMAAGNVPAQNLISLLHVQLGNLFLDAKKHITGKLGPGFKDDLAMAFMLGIYWSNKLRSANPQLVHGKLVVY